MSRSLSPRSSRRCIPNPRKSASSMDVNQRIILTVFIIVCFCFVVRREVLAAGYHRRLTDLNCFWPVACLFSLYCTIIYTQREFPIRSRLVSRLRTVGFISSPNPPSNHEHETSESHQGENERPRYMDNQSIDGCQMGCCLPAENTRRLAYHVTAPRWNLRAPSTTGSGR
jgi:hypothetical protein